MARHFRLALEVLVTALVISGCGSLPSSGTASSPPPSSQPSVSSSSLLAYTARGTDLGAGWTETATTDASNLAIDNGSHPCHRPYPSDALRQAKNGVTILNTGDPSQVASDIAHYRDHGAEQALEDVRKAINACTAYEEVNAEGARIAIDVHLSAASTTSLGDDRVAMDRRATLGGRSIYSVVFFIRVGEYVTTVFTLSGDPAEAGKLAGLAAAASVTRLKAAAAA